MATIQFHRDTSANRESVNPVLADGEPGYATATDTLKIGDGSTAWVDLPALANGLTATVTCDPDDPDVTLFLNGVEL